MNTREVNPNQESDVSTKGVLILALKKSPGNKAEHFLGKVEKFLGEATQVRTKKQQIIIQFEDIGEITNLPLWR